MQHEGGADSSPLKTERPLHRSPYTSLQCFTALHQEACADGKRVTPLKCSARTVVRSRERTPHSAHTLSLRRSELAARQDIRSLHLACVPFSMGRSCTAPWTRTRAPAERPRAHVRANVRLRERSLDQALQGCPTTTLCHKGDPGASCPSIPRSSHTDTPIRCDSAHPDLP